MRAFTLVLTGRADEALAQAETLVELARMLECIEGEGFALTMRGFALAALGKPEEATSQLEETLVRARRFGHREHTLATLLFLSIAQQATGHLQQAGPKRISEVRTGDRQRAAAPGRAAAATP